jgi:hypothetical protein
MLQSRRGERSSECQRLRAPAVAYEMSRKRNGEKSCDCAGCATFHRVRPSFRARLRDPSSIAAALVGDIAGSGPRAPLLTALVRFLLTGSGLGRWQRRHDRSRAPSLATCKTIGRQTCRSTKALPATRFEQRNRRPSTCARLRTKARTLGRPRSSLAQSSYSSFPSWRCSSRLRSPSRTSSDETRRTARAVTSLPA